MKIDIRIDKIVLDGIELSPRELGQLRAYIESELTQRSANARELDAIQGSLQRIVRSDPMDLSRQVSGQDLGKQIASSVLGGLIV